MIECERKGIGQLLLNPNFITSKGGMACYAGRSALKNSFSKLCDIIGKKNKQKNIYLSVIEN